MKELLRHILTWFAGLFNFGVFVSDKMDSLLLKLQILEFSKEASELEHLYHVAMILEGTKCVLMLFSLIMLYLLNQEDIEKFCKSVWSWFKKAFLFLKRFFTNLFHKKHKN